MSLAWYLAKLACLALWFSRCTTAREVAVDRVCGPYRDLAWRSAICIALGNSFNIAFLFADRLFGGLLRDRASSERPRGLCNFSIPLWLTTAATVFGLFFIRLWVMWSSSCKSECLCLAVQLTPPSVHSAEELNGSVSEA